MDRLAAFIQFMSSMVFPEYLEMRVLVPTAIYWYRPKHAKENHLIYLEIPHHFIHYVTMV